MDINYIGNEDVSKNYFEDGAKFFLRKTLTRY